MSFSIRQTRDLVTLRKLEAKVMPEDLPVDSDHTFWLVRDGDGLPVGFCSAVYRPQLDYVFLSRAAIDPSVQGHGLQRRMIRARVAWARAQGASRVITYTLLKNYASMVNLLREGFRFYHPDHKYVGDGVHYLMKDL